MIMDDGARLRLSTLFIVTSSPLPVGTPPEIGAIW